MSLYMVNSTTFGSTMRKRTSSGVDLKRMLLIRELMHTLLPAPVAPATSRWGIFARSAANGSPEIVLPRAMVSLDSALRKALDSRISRR